MQYESGIETFVTTNPNAEMRIKSVEIKHNSQGDLLGITYTIEQYKLNGEPVDPRLVTVGQDKLSSFQLLVRGRFARKTLFYPQTSDDGISQLCPGALPNVIISDFLNRIMNPNYTPKVMKLDIAGFKDYTWQDKKMNDGTFDHYRFLPLYMVCRYEYDYTENALVWRGGDIMYQPLEEPEGKVTIAVSEQQYIEYVNSNKRSPVTLQVS